MMKSAGGGGNVSGHLQQWNMRSGCRRPMGCLRGPCPCWGKIHTRELGEKLPGSAGRVVCSWTAATLSCIAKPESQAGPMSLDSHRRGPLPPSVPM